MGSNMGFENPKIFPSSIGHLNFKIGSFPKTIDQEIERARTGMKKIYKEGAW